MSRLDGEVFIAIESNPLAFSPNRGLAERLDEVGVLKRAGLIKPELSSG